MEYITCSKLGNILQRQTGRAAPPCALRPKGNEPHLGEESTYRTFRGNSFVFELMVGCLFALFLIFVLLWFPGVTKNSNTDRGQQCQPITQRARVGEARTELYPLAPLQSSGLPVSESICRPTRECMYLSTALARPALHSLFLYPDHTEPGDLRWRRKCTFSLRIRGWRAIK